jgi:hypothetical protein
MLFGRQKSTTMGEIRRLLAHWYYFLVPVPVFYIQICTGTGSRLSDQDQWHMFCRILMCRHCAKSKLKLASVSCATIAPLALGPLTLISHYIVTLVLVPYGFVLLREEHYELREGLR